MLPTIEMFELFDHYVLMDIRVIGKIILSEQQRNTLRSLGTSYFADDNPPSREDVSNIINRVGDANIILINISTPITKAVIESCPNLEFIQTWSTGTDHIDLDLAKQKNILVKNVPGFSTESVAEKTLGLMLLLANQISEAHTDALSGNWNYTAFCGMELQGKTLAIIGMGAIGSRVGQLARAFGMHVLPLSSRTTESELFSALSTADIVSLHCPYTTQTHHLIGKKTFQHMKQGCYLINNSRGGVVDESALLWALNQGIVAHASMDVFESEPPGKDNLLLHHPRCYVTPHIAWNTHEARHNLSEICVKNIAEYCGV